MAVPIELVYGAILLYNIDRTTSVDNISVQSPPYKWGSVYQIGTGGATLLFGDQVLYNPEAAFTKIVYSGGVYLVIDESEIKGIDRLLP